MAELIPDTWVYLEVETVKCCQPQKKGKVKDIVLTTKYPESASSLMVYQRTILHTGRTYKGDYWLSYDTNYRHRAAACKSLNWAQLS